VAEALRRWQAALLPSFGKASQQQVLHLCGGSTPALVAAPDVGGTPVLWRSTRRQHRVTPIVSSKIMSAFSADRKMSVSHLRRLSEFGEPTQCTHGANQEKFSININKSKTILHFQLGILVDKGRFRLA
jgi:hypothetical protein